MSGKAMHWVFQARAGSTNNERLVLLAIADHADEHGKNSYPGIGTLADETALSRRSVQYAIRSLEDLGVLNVERRNGTSCMFSINMHWQRFTSVDTSEGCNTCTPLDDEGVQEMHPQGDGGCNTCTPGVHHVHPGGATHAPQGCNTCTQKVFKGSIKDPLNTPTADISHSYADTQTNRAEGGNLDSAQKNRKEESTKETAYRLLAEYESWFEAEKGERPFPKVTPPGARNKRLDAVGLIEQFLSRGIEDHRLAVALRSAKTLTYAAVDLQLEVNPAAKRPLVTHNPGWHSPEVEAAIEQTLREDAPSEFWRDRLVGSTDDARQEVLNAWLVSNERRERLTEQGRPLGGVEGDPIWTYLRSE